MRPFLRVFFLSPFLLVFTQRKVDIWEQMKLKNTKWISVFGWCDPNVPDVASLEISVKNKSGWGFFSGFQSRATFQVFWSLCSNTKIHLIIFYKITRDKKLLTLDEVSDSFKNKILPIRDQLKELFTWVIILAIFLILKHAIEYTTHQSIIYRTV